MPGETDGQGSGSLLVPIVACIFAAYYLYDVWGERTETMLYGLLIGSLVLVLCAVTMVTRLLQRLVVGGDQDRSSSSLPGLPWQRLQAKWRCVFLFSSLVLYAILQPWLGFTLATAVFLGGAFWLLGTRRPAHWLSATIGLTLIAHIAFIYLLKAPLPGGVLF